MTKKDLMNGDIVVLRSGLVGVVIINGDTSYLMFQNEGWEELDDYYNDDMIAPDFTEYDGEPDSIMQVYRTDYGFSFSDFDEYEPIYVRDVNWLRPSKEEMKARAKEKKEKELALIEEARKTAKKPQKDLIFVVAQQFYGNRSGTKIERDKVDYFLHGYLDYSLKKPTTDLKIVHVPSSEHVVIVYDQLQEDEYVNITFPKTYAEHGAEYKKDTGKELTMHVSCEIPEINFKIHTRCFACRIDHNGNLCSLLEGDGKFVEKYFAM